MSNPGNAELSDVTLKQAEDRQATILKNINQLQEQEKKLYRELEVSAATGGVFGDQDAIVKKINDQTSFNISIGIGTTAPDATSPQE